MPTVERFEDLVVWQEAREIVKVVYRLTSKFPRKELYGLADQIQKAAVSTMSNVAEGFESGDEQAIHQFPIHCQRLQRRGTFPGLRCARSGLHLAN